jgi:DNA-binding response OmpR family regulator
VPKVLLVEDDATQLRIREAVVRGAGFEVLTAADAESALRILRSASSSENESVGIIITDHYLPGITGVEFLQKIRETNPVVPVIVLSGLPGAETEYEGLGVIFRSKPCPPADIISLVRRSLDHAA